MLSLTIFVPISTADAVIFSKDDEPCTTKFAVTNKEPVIICVPMNVLPPLNFAYEPVTDSNEVNLLFCAVFVEFIEDVALSIFVKRVNALALKVSKLAVSINKDEVTVSKVVALVSNTEILVF